jgi:hypothetical protein
MIGRLTNSELQGMWKEAVVPGRTEEGQVSRTLGRNLKPGPPEYEAGVPAIRSRRCDASGLLECDAAEVCRQACTSSALHRVELKRSRCPFL